MSSTKIYGKQAMVNTLERAGYSIKEANHIIAILADTMSAELLLGNKVSIPKVLTVIPRVNPAKVMQVGGKFKDIPEQIKLRVVTSLVFKATFDTQYSKSGKKQQELNSLAGKLGKNE